MVRRKGREHVVRTGEGTDVLTGEKDRGKLGYEVRTKEAMW